MNRQLSRGVADSKRFASADRGDFGDVHGRHVDATGDRSSVQQDRGSSGRGFHTDERADAVVRAHAGLAQQSGLRAKRNR
jgi:hypothetical protein